MRMTAKIIMAGALALLASATAAQQSRVAPSVHPPARPEGQFAPVDASHLFVAAGAMAGDTLTSVQLEDPDGTATIVRVKVGAGSQPLTLFLYSESPVIWDFEGAVERVQRVIAAPGQRSKRVAFRGLAADRIEITDTDRCLPAIFPPWNVP